MAGTPYEEDTAVWRAAEAHGLRVQRLTGVKITDPAAIRAAGLVRESPDYTAIRRRLAAGETVEGAEASGVFEYYLRRAEVDHA